MFVSVQKIAERSRALLPPVQADKRKVSWCRRLESASLFQCHSWRRQMIRQHLPAWLHWNTGLFEGFEPLRVSQITAAFFHLLRLMCILFIYCFAVSTTDDRECFGRNVCCLVCLYVRLFFLFFAFIRDCEFWMREAMKKTELDAADWILWVFIAESKIFYRFIDLCLLDFYGDGSNSNKYHLK